VVNDLGHIPALQTLGNGLADAPKG